jgi:hypothetical protein
MRGPPPSDIPASYSANRRHISLSRKEHIAVLEQGGLGVQTHQLVGAGRRTVGDDSHQTFGL